MRRLLIFIFLFLGSWTAIHADYTPSAVASLDSAKLLMGRTQRLQLKVAIPSDSAKVDFPLLKQLASRRFVGLVNDTVEILKSYRIDTLLENQQKFLNYNFMIQSFDSGRYELPPFELKIDGQVVKSNSVSLEVIPVNVKAEDEIDNIVIDVIPPFELLPEGLLKEEEIPQKYKAWIVWLAIGATVLLAALIYMYIHYRRTGKLLPSSKPLTPAQLALKQLSKLENQHLWEKGKVKEYYTRLTDILRRYLRSQFYIKTLERTSTEIMDDVMHNSVLKNHAEQLNALLTLSDFVKFAKENPDNDENLKILRLARGFISQTAQQQMEQSNTSDSRPSEAKKNMDAKRRVVVGHRPDTRKGGGR